MGSQKREPPHRDERRPYKAPTLVDYGSIPARTLTSQAAGSIIDIMAVKEAKVYE